MKKAYLVDSRCTECIKEHGLELFDAKLFTGKISKSHKRVNIYPTNNTGDAYCVYTSLSSDQMQKKLDQAKGDHASYKQAKHNFLTLVYMDFLAYVKADFMQPKETERQRALYIKDLDLLKDTAKEPILN